MHIYQKKENAKYMVQFITGGILREIKDFDTEDEAAAYVSYLNGGADPRLTRRQLDPRFSYKHGER